MSNNEADKGISLGGTEMPDIEVPVDSVKDMWMKDKD